MRMDEPMVLSAKQMQQEHAGVYTFNRTSELMSQGAVAGLTGKPVGINEYIGRRPIAAFGNSDGDLEMLQWTTMSEGVRLGLLVHHTDAVREYAYDRDTPFGRLDKALDVAAMNHWEVVDMKNDWKRIFAFEGVL